MRARPSASRSSGRIAEDFRALKDVSHAPFDRDGGVAAPRRVALLATGETLEFSYDAATRTVAVSLPAARRTTLVDVVRIELSAPP